MNNKNKSYIKFLCRRLKFSKENLEKWEELKKEVSNREDKDNKIQHLELCKFNIKYLETRIESLNLSIDEFLKLTGQDKKEG